MSKLLISKMENCGECINCVRITTSVSIDEFNEITYCYSCNLTGNKITDKNVISEDCTLIEATDEVMKLVSNINKEDLKGEKNNV